MNTYFNNLMKMINKANHIKKEEYIIKFVNEIVSYALYIFYSGYITEEDFNYAISKLKMNPCIVMYEKEKNIAITKLIENNDLLNDFYLNALTIYNKYKIEPKDVFHTNKDFKKVFEEFLKYMNCYDLYRKMVNSKRISYNSPVIGESICLGNNSDSYIIINEKDNLYRYISLVHELAHAKENEVLKDHKGYFDLSSTNEILSLTFNRLFLEYLKENDVLSKNDINQIKNNFEINCLRYMEWAMLMTIAVRSKVFTLNDYSINMHIDNSVMTRKLTDHNYSIGAILSYSLLDMWRKNDKAFISDIPNMSFYLNKMNFKEVIELSKKYNCMEKELDKVFIKK